MLKWTGYLSRMRDSRLPKKLIFGQLLKAGYLKGQSCVTKRKTERQHEIIQHTLSFLRKQSDETKELAPVVLFQYAKVKVGPN